MKNSLYCNYCRSKKSKKIFDLRDYKTKDKFKLLICKKCFLVRTSPKLTGEQLEKYYANYREKSGKRFWQPLENVLNFWHLRRVSKIKKLKDKGRILDIGCGRGVELEKLKEFGWKVHGTEYFNVSKTELEKKGIKIFLGDIWEAKYPDRYFDVVTMWHSMEHITNPKRVIQESKRILKENGMLKIAVPNFESLERVLFGKNWFHLDVPRHLFHFSGNSLSFMLSKNGFEISNVRYIAPEYDFYSFCQTLLNKISQEKYLIYKILNGEIRIKNKIPQLIYQIPFLFLFGFVSLFFVPLTWALKKSSTVEITARKI